MSHCHDATLYHQSRIDEILLDCLFLENRKFNFCSSPAYILKLWLHLGLNNALVAPEQTTIDVVLNSVREVAERSHKVFKQMQTCQYFNEMLKARIALVAFM